MESMCGDKLQVLTESVEQLNLVTTSMPVANFNQSDPKDGGSDDFWCEDEPNNFSDESLNNVSPLDREWKWRQAQFHTMGYRDGLFAGKEASAQEGFNVGFMQSVPVGYNWGLVRGITSAVAALPDQLKENLVGTLENREKFQNLYESVQRISSNDALKMFHNSILETGSASSPDHSKENFYDKAMTDGAHSCNQLSSHFEELVSILHGSPEIKFNAEMS